MWRRDEGDGGGVRKDGGRGGDDGARKEEMEKV